MNTVNTLRKLAGMVWMVAAPAMIYLLLHGAYRFIGAGNKEINQATPWMIIIAIFAPIAVGFFIFGWYCFKGEYHRLPEKLEEL